MTSEQGAHPAAAPFSLGVGGPLGFGGNISPATLTFVDGLDERPYCAAGTEAAPRVLEVRVHGVGGSSPEQLLEQAEYVQVGGDDLAQFIRRWGRGLRIVPWPLEGYWWGGLTSKPASRALWSLFFPLLLSNLAAWMAPARPAGYHSRPWLAGTGACLAVALRWAGYALTLVFTASVATASLDTFGWQCTGPAVTGACRVHWLDQLPSGAGPRMTLFALVPLVVLALLGLAGRRTASSYERWRILQSVRSGKKLAAERWPLAAAGFWHGQRPVRRLQALHLAGAAGLISLYLAWVPSSHAGWHWAAIIAALVMIAGPALLLAFPHTGRPGANPYAAMTSASTSHPGKSASDSDDRTGFDIITLVLLAASAALVAALVLARLWWRPVNPPASDLPGLLPGDAGIWVGLSIAMAALTGAVLVLTGIARAIVGHAARTSGAPRASRAFRPFACGFLGPATIGLACLTGGVLAAGINLAVTRLLIGSSFRVGPAFPDQPPSYPVEVAWPLSGYLSAFLAMAAVLLVTAAGVAVLFWVRAQRNTGTLKRYYTGPGNGGTTAQRRRIAWQWSMSRAADFIGQVTVALALAGLGALLAFYFDDPSFVGVLVSFGQWLVGAGAVALYGYTVSALTNQGKRAKIQLLWDVGTFWPRACQPFAPPCYMERSVPELVNRLDNLLKGSEKGPEEQQEAEAEKKRRAAVAARDLAARLAPRLNQDDLVNELVKLSPAPCDRIVVNGYSQGAPIAAASIAQLPKARIEAISLLTVGSPLRRLYGRGFPVFFGPACLTELRTLLSGAGDDVRWLNAVRNSDYIGGYIFGDPYGAGRLKEDLQVDKAVLDPVCVTADDGDDATLPVIHGHADFWPDPQVALLTQALVTDACGRPRPAAVPARHAATGTAPLERAAEPAGLEQAPVPAQLEVAVQPAELDAAVVLPRAAAGGRPPAAGRGNDRGRADQGAGGELG